jgi:APA family basic amino acid/polyamine antiporter
MLSPFIAFAINCIILISNAASLSGVALIGSEYFAQAFFATPPDDFTKALIAMCAIIAFYFVNLAGLRMSSKTQNILMLIKIGMILVLLLALFFPSKFHAPEVAATAHHYDWMTYVKSIGLALIAVSFTYGGYSKPLISEKK